MSRPNRFHNDSEPYPIMLMFSLGPLDRDGVPGSTTRRSVRYHCLLEGFVLPVNIHERYIWNRLLLQSCLGLMSLALAQS